MQPNKTPEKPKQQPEASPVVESAPQTQAAPEQPVIQTQPTGQPQYIVTHRSLEGVGGWLAFWLVIFALAAIGSIYTFFTQISGEASVDFKVVDVIFSPIMAIVYVAAILLIVMRKKIGKWIAIAAFVTSGLYSMVTVLTNPIENVAMIISSLVVMWLVVGLFSLYFLKSERVKQTLTK